MIKLEEKIAKEILNNYENVELLYLPQVICTFDPIKIKWNVRFINVYKRSEVMKILKKSHVALRKTLNKGFRPEWEINNSNNVNIKEEKDVSKTNRKKAA